MFLDQPQLDEISLLVHSKVEILKIGNLERRATKKVAEVHQ